MKRKIDELLEQNDYESALQLVLYLPKAERFEILKKIAALTEEKKVCLEIMEQLRSYGKKAVSVLEQLSVKVPVETANMLISLGEYKAVANIALNTKDEKDRHAIAKTLKENYQYKQAVRRTLAICVGFGLLVLSMILATM